MSELKPCELCGGDYHVYYDLVGYKVNCQNRKCKLYLVPLTREQWNTRTQSQCKSTNPEMLKCLCESYAKYYHIAISSGVTPNYQNWLSLSNEPTTKTGEWL